MRRVFVMCAAAVILMAASVTPTFLQQDDPDYCPCHGQNCSCGLSPNSYWPRYCGHNDICDCARQGETCCGNDGTICSTTAVCSDCGPPQSSTPCKESKYPWNADGCCPAKDGIMWWAWEMHQGTHQVSGSVLVHLRHGVFRECVRTELLE